MREQEDGGEAAGEHGPQNTQPGGGRSGETGFTTDSEEGLRGEEEEGGGGLACRHRGRE